MTPKIDLAAWLPVIVETTRAAGAAVMEIFESGDFRTEYKADNSPLTRADLASNEIILAALHQLTPKIPIISEESLKLSAEERRHHSVIWLVDPVDGTKEFVNKRPDFTVNIGLIEAGRPVLGAVYAPARGVMYWGAEGLGAWRQLDGQPEQAIKPVATPAGGQPVVAVSHSHPSLKTQAYLESLGPHQLLSRGSSLKVCYVADGTVSQYPRFSPCMEWDTAAADAVLRAAGGLIRQAENRRTLVYNKDNLYNPFFIAWPSPASR